MHSQSNPLVIIPARNEEDSIGRVINEIKSSDHALEILVVNDGSTDDTAKIARSMGVRTADLPFSLGIGGAVQTGFKIAKKLNCNAVVQVDADGQHDPAYIQELMKPIDDGKTDISIGSRRMNGDSPKSSVPRSAGIKFFSWLTSKTLSQVVTDCSSG